MSKNRQKTYISSTRKKSPLNKKGNILLEVVRLILGIVFTFSGFVKVIDPLGSTYKIQDYLNAFGGFFPNLLFLALPAAILLSTFELALGLCFLLKIKTKTTSIFAFIFILCMLPLTLYIALKNPVTDCGCFGDALILSNWQTFYKNIVLLFLILMLLVFHKRIRNIFQPTMEWTSILIFLAIGVGLSIYSLRHEPIIDFRPYKVGVNIPEAMKIPAGKPVDKFDTKLIYQKNGIKQEFTLENYPKNDSTWTFVEQKTSLIEKGYQPPIHNFNIVDANGNDITESILHEPKVYLLIIYDVSKASESGAVEAQKIYENAVRSNAIFYALTASTDEDVAQFVKKTGITYPFCKTDPITLKTIIRSNPGIIIIENGLITGKSGWRDFSKM